VAVDAVIQHDLAEVPVVADLCIPQAGNDELAGGVNDPGVGGKSDLTAAADGTDAVALDNDDRIRHGHAAIAVNQRASLDDQGLSLRLRGQADWSDTRTRMRPAKPATGWLMSSPDSSPEMKRFSD